MKSFNCMWKHCECEQRICCHFCKKKTCEWRCTDDHMKCKFVDTQVEKKEPNIIVTEVINKIRVHNEIVDSNLRDRLLKYKKQNRMHNDTLAEKIGVTSPVIQRVLSKSPVVKIRSDSYNIIKEFVR